MQYRQVPRTDVKVSVVCFGPMRFAARGGVEDDRSKAGEEALRLALDRDVNFIHSSFQYGTRWLLDKVLKDHPKRHDLHHMIKVIVPGLGDNREFSADKFRSQIETALRQLHTERITFVQYLFKDATFLEDEINYMPILPAMLEQVKEIFEDLRDEGKVGYLGAQGHTTRLRHAMVASGLFDFVVEAFNLVRMEMAEHVTDLQTRGMSLFPIQPLDAGLLTDERADRSALPVDDRFCDDKHTDHYNRLTKARELLADEIGPSLTSFALRFALSLPPVPAVITGMNNRKQVEGVLKAADGPMVPAEVLEKAFELWRAHKAA
jgi:aryl-alcohol dehydrogenase-like predicted oxidoreductase